MFPQSPRHRLTAVPSLQQYVCHGLQVHAIRGAIPNSRREITSVVTADSNATSSPFVRAIGLVDPPGGLGIRYASIYGTGKATSANRAFSAEWKT